MSERGCWDRDKNCRPCWLRQFDGFPVRALNIWHRVASGELVDSEEEVERWSIDWLAFRTMIDIGHSLTTDDEPEELFDAMIDIRSAMQLPAGEAAME